MTMDEMLFREETKSEKEERMKVIGTSLVISQLENDLDVILTKKLRVSDTEERIERLKDVIGLLQGFTYSKKETDEKNFKKPHETVEAVQNVSDYGMKKEEERDMEIVQKSEEKDKVNSSTGAENIEEKTENKDNDDDNTLQRQENANLYIKTNQENICEDKKEDEKKETPELEDRNYEKDKNSEEDTEGKKNEQKDGEKNSSLDEASANDEKYVNKEDLESGHKKGEERRNDVLEEKVIDENRNESAVNVKTNIKKDVSIKEKLVESDKDGNKNDDNRCEKRNRN